MTKYKTFAIPEQTEPLIFVLGDQKFFCRGRVASGAILRLGETIGNEDDDAADLIKALRNFFKAALLEDDYKRFNEMLDDPDLAVPIETVNEIAGWLAQEYTNERPTGRPSPPTSLKESSGEDSTDSSSPVASISSKSRRTEVSA